MVKINIKTELKEGVSEEDNKKEIELSLKKACKEIINKYKTNPLDIDFSSLSTGKIEVSGDVKIISSSFCTVKNASELAKEMYQGNILYNKDNNTYYYILDKDDLDKDEQEGAVILCPFIDKPKLEQGKYIQLGFDAVDVANYMAEEINNNIKSEEVRQMANFHKIINDIDCVYSNTTNEELDHYSKIYNQYVCDNKLSYRVVTDLSWFNSVRTDEEWDHKWQLSALFPSMGLSRRYYHMYNNTEIYYDIWSNIHYGVIGSIVYNYDDEYILNGAGQAQRWSDNNFIVGVPILWDYVSGLKKGSEYDNPKDRFYINEGIILYDNKKNITAEQLLEIAVKQPVIDNKDHTDVEYK